MSEEKSEGVSSQNVQEPINCEICGEPEIERKWWQIRSKLTHWWKHIKVNWHLVKMARLCLELRDMSDEDKFLILTTVDYSNLKIACQWKVIEYMMTGDEEK